MALTRLYDLLQVGLCFAHCLLAAGCCGLAVSCLSFEQVVQLRINARHVFKHIKGCRRHVGVREIHGNVLRVGRLSHLFQLVKIVKTRLWAVAAVDGLLQSVAHQVHITLPVGCQAVGCYVVDQPHTGFCLSCVVGVSHSAEHVYAHVGICRQLVYQLVLWCVARKRNLAYCLVCRLLYHATARLCL